eukprot:TRINITY_DN5589_c0_g1_i2.p1 TRINITY_DN5589_c0_g1~~TRINITY_DN5589_c0_g1_i2.p1  ORF type:complete len:130 (-),score=24.05 TRINITY_DN5589_c0_g1_i2:623-1012(-)
MTIASLILKISHLAGPFDCFFTLVDQMTQGLKLEDTILDFVSFVLRKGYEKEYLQILFRSDNWELIPLILSKSFPFFATPPLKELETLLGADDKLMEAGNRLASEWISPDIFKICDFIRVSSESTTPRS